ncbi:(d)CMP kinase [Gluconobacter kanchanaburiensis]|uniref:Cytidylate kinase n=1 Tax=Gluconobacter kanchanaburiensis NBRC 103587 TaxID=1307948 RepID=A0A511B4H7_9PROT|nr:(d)CMP kinase [Gluconobacter kanchanaburiensis]MBF0861638.1 (d)CMP kinase [Gluconobacter kanchanaburiensis]GBR67141.1 cytidylate kinase [Gluconobacter kanchanaburiensis NBRC 103587]GEK95284.1 cytidylate kinase [Gluconobacter kanchanaburiensis NBRC 103587]
MTARPLVIAVDGPAAAGKGTLAKALAAKLGLPYLDTGLLYRAVARRVVNAGLDPAGDASSEAQALQQEDLARTDLRVPEIDRGASLVAAQPAVRAALLERQRVFASETGAVVDGRDIGTVVFPDADVKFFITASPRTRALRRHHQVTDGTPLDGKALEAAVAEIVARDERDSTRETAPLVQAADAVLIETDSLSAAEVLDKACEIVALRRPRG